MPVVNHFAPPLSEHRNWTGFHSKWANTISDHLNRVLPDGFFAEPNVRWRQEADAIVVEDDDPPGFAVGLGGYVGDEDGGVAVAEAPPAVQAPPGRVLDYDPDHDVAEVRVLNDRGQSLRLAAAVEIVSPSNKDRPDERTAFVGKVEGYVSAGVGVVVLDTVFPSKRSPHRELMQRLGDEDPEADATFAAAYRLTERRPRKVEIWHHAVAVGTELPELPPFLKRGPAVPVPLQATYMEACLNTRVDAAAVLREQAAADA